MDIIYGTITGIYGKYHGFCIGVIQDKPLNKNPVKGSSSKGPKDPIISVFRGSKNGSLASYKALMGAH